MPIRYELDPVLPLVRSCLSGCVTTDDVIAHYDRLSLEPQFDSSFWHLADIRDLTEFVGDPQSIRVAASRPVFEQGVRRAILVRTATQFAIAQEFAAHARAAGHIVAIFDDVTSAQSWLWSVRPD